MQDRIPSIAPVLELIELRRTFHQGTRAIDVLDAATEDLQFAHADLGAREQALDVLQSRLEDEEISLREVMSVEYDVDAAEVVSTLTAKQAAFQKVQRGLDRLIDAYQIGLLERPQFEPRVRRAQEQLKSERPANPSFHRGGSAVLCPPIKEVQYGTEDIEVVESPGPVLAEAC